MYIVCFGPYGHNDFVPGDSNPLLSLMPQNTYNMLATNTTNKTNYQTLTRWCEILQSTPFKEPDDLVGTTGQLVRSALIPNVTTQFNMLYIVRFRPYRPHGFVPGDAIHLPSLTPQNAYNMLATNTINNVSYQILIRQYEILHIILLVFINIIKFSFTITLFKTLINLDWFN
jgi:hypothetical protein